MTDDATMRASGNRLVRPSGHRRTVFAPTLIGITLVWLLLTPPGDAATTATMLPSGDAIELTGDLERRGRTVTIPIHRSGGIRYFSAGVGMEERQAEYPPFSLKLILVAGPKAYLSKAGVTITNDSGTVRVDIPSDNVNGPWVFVDLPDGTYDIEAVSAGEQVDQRGVHVREGRTRTVYLRWPRGPELF